MVLQQVKILGFVQQRCKHRHYCPRLALMKTKMDLLKGRFDELQYATSGSMANVYNAISDASYSSTKGAFTDYGALKRCICFVFFTWQRRSSVLKSLIAVYRYFSIDSFTKYLRTTPFLWTSHELVAKVTHHSSAVLVLCWKCCCLLFLYK